MHACIYKYIHVVSNRFYVSIYLFFYFYIKIHGGHLLKTPRSTLLSAECYLIILIPFQDESRDLF